MPYARAMRKASAVLVGMLDRDGGERSIRTPPKTTSPDAERVR